MRVSGFPVFFNVLLRPFVSTMAALVRILEFLNIDDDGSTALLSKENGGSLILAKTQWSFLYR